MPKLAESLYRTMRWLSHRLGVTVSRNVLTLPELYNLPISECELERVGPAGDGSYLLPIWWRELDTLISPGVGTEFGFDLAFAEHGKRSVLMLDPTVTLDELPSGMTHIRFWLGRTEAPDTWTLSRCLEHIDESQSSSRLMLQMDIEGAEWQILAGADDEILSRFEIVIIEFHDLDKYLDRRSSCYARLAIENLCEQFELVSLEPTRGALELGNGPYRFHQTVETTWIRKAKLRSEASLGEMVPRTAEPSQTLGHS